MDQPQLASIDNFLQLSDQIATAGQPTVEQFAAIQAAGYEVVVNLALPDSPRALADEAAIVQNLGLTYIAIPVLWESPGLSDVQQFFQAMQANVGKKVLVHCAANMRVSAFMYLYRRICVGIDRAAAEKDLHQIWVPNDCWQGFINLVLQHYVDQKPGF